ncbi:MAG: cyclopropane fatty acyl phospholipid synthase [Ignavibacteriales bacterium]|nr:cyclopropane fatty acyl phospholipid synthase [Ignavibacteriales bacterium]
MFIFSRPLFKTRAQDLLALADVRINGDRRWDIQIHDERFYGRVLTEGAMGLGESYMDEWWDCRQLDEFFYRIFSARLEEKVKGVPTVVWAKIVSRLKNLQTRAGSKNIAQRHYDLKAELYESFLDPYNQYTCAYFKDTEDLKLAQEQKLDLICQKLNISSQDKVLDIGCGWGGFAKFAAQRYGCSVTGVSISREQVMYAREFCKGLPVTILKQDYRDLTEPSFTKQFDKILVCGMIEHVGYKNYRRLMKIIESCLKDNGIFLLQTIGSNVSMTTMETNPWMGKYIFPNSMLPSLKQLTTASEGLFVAEDIHNFSVHYDKTLMAWSDNFEKNWPKIESHFDRRFYRMWRYYLLSCAGGFRARDTQLWQIVYSKRGMPGGYVSVR